MTDTNKTKEITSTSTIAQDSSEMFDTYKHGVLKVTEGISKFQPQYAQSISNLQQEYLQMTKEFVNKVFAAQRYWAGKSNVTSTSTTFPTSTYAPYAEQFRRQSNEITAQALSVFDTSNQ
ncbi:MAG: hypothetical protein WBL54_02255, partial [Nitrososphaeraceae archaeon]